MVLLQLVGVTLSNGEKHESCLFCCIVNVLCVQTPVNDVEEQVGQGKYDSGVGVDHVAVAHYEAHVLS